MSSDAPPCAATSSYRQTGLSWFPPGRWRCLCLCSRYATQKCPSFCARCFSTGMLTVVAGQQRQQRIALLRVSHSYGASCTALRAMRLVARPALSEVCSVFFFVLPLVQANGRGAGTCLHCGWTDSECGHGCLPCVRVASTGCSLRTTSNTIDERTMRPASTMSASATQRNAKSWGSFPHPVSRMGLQPQPTNESAQPRPPWPTTVDEWQDQQGVAVPRKAADKVRSGLDWMGRPTSIASNEPATGSQQLCWCGHIGARDSMSQSR